MNLMRYVRFGWSFEMMDVEMVEDDMSRTAFARVGVIAVQMNALPSGSDLCG